MVCQLVAALLLPVKEVQELPRELPIIRQISLSFQLLRFVEPVYGARRGTKPRGLGLRCPRGHPAGPCCGGDGKDGLGVELNHRHADLQRV